MFYIDEHLISSTLNLEIFDATPKSEAMIQKQSAIVPKMDEKVLA